MVDQDLGAHKAGSPEQNGDNGKNMPNRQGARGIFNTDFHGHKYKNQKNYIWGNTYSFLWCFIGMNRQDIADRMAFSKVYETFAPMVMRRCLALLKDEAEAGDMMQNVFLRIYTNRNTLDLSSPSSLLWNTATRLCLNRIRDKKRRGLNVDCSEMLLQIAVADDEQDAYAASGILAKIFAKEQESTRTIAVLHFVDGMTLEETADAVGLSVSGVRKRLRTLQAKVKNLEVK